MSTHGVIAEPHEHGWRGRYVYNDGNPSHLGVVLYDAVVGHFGGHIDAARDYFLHQHTSWSSIGGDFAQPTGNVILGPGVPSADDVQWNGRRNQCYCHGDYLKPGEWVDKHDPNHGAYAYVLGETAMVVEVPGHRDDVWWKVAEVPWNQPPPDWDHLHHHDYR